MKKFKGILGLFLALILIMALASCGAKTTDSGTSADSETSAAAGSDTAVDAGDDTAGDDAASPDNNAEVRTITVAYSQGNAPCSYVDDNGELVGYEIDVLKLVDDMLPQYEFEFTGTTLDDLATGITEGAYQIGVSNSFKNAEREEKMLFPDNPIGASIIGMIVRTEDSDCDTIRKCVEKGMELCPIAPSDGMFVVVDNYNKANPDAPVIFSTAEIYTLADFYIYVAEGRFDYCLIAASLWDVIVGNEDAELHYLSDQIMQYNVDAVKTWTLMNKGETDLCAAVSDCLGQLKEDGTLDQLQVQWFGVDQFEYLNY